MNFFFKHSYYYGIRDMTKIENCKQQYQLVHNLYTDATISIQGSTPYRATHA